MDSSSTRRTFAVRFGSILSALGIASVGLAGRASAKSSDTGIRKLNGEGKPGTEKDVIMPVVIHNCVVYVSGIGAHDSSPQSEWTIENHTKKVMDQLQKMVEIGGGNMDTVLQANVFLTNIQHWDGMHKVFATYFPHGGPARTTVAVAALPGNSLVEINCIAAVAHK